ncbi:MAG: hypothetical protein HC834_07005 [Rhodospirillales bacterium]|nr:hypothetical protein [Rhodospirillales bacterium]
MRRLKTMALGVIFAAALILASPLTATAVTGPLTAQEISNALATSRALKPLHAKYGPQLAEYAKTVTPPDPNTPRDPCAITPEVANAPGFEEMEQVVRSNGFESGEAYCRTMQRIVQAYTAVQVEEHAGELQQKLQEARAQIEADDSIPAEQKQQILGQLTEHPMTRAARNVSAEDKLMIAQFRPELDQLFLPPPGSVPATPSNSPHPFNNPSTTAS